MQRGEERALARRVALGMRAPRVRAAAHGAAAAPAHARPRAPAAAAAAAVADGVEIRGRLEGLGGEGGVGHGGAVLLAKEAGAAEEVGAGAEHGGLEGQGRCRGGRTEVGMEEVAAPVAAAVGTSLPCNSRKLLALDLEEADGLLDLLCLLDLLRLQAVAASALVLSCPHYAWRHKSRAVARVPCFSPFYIDAKPSPELLRERQRAWGFSGGALAARNGQRKRFISTPTGTGDVRS